MENHGHTAAPLSIDIRSRGWGSRLTHRLAAGEGLRHAGTGFKSQSESGRRSVDFRGDFLRVERKTDSKRGGTD